MQNIVQGTKPYSQELMLNFDEEIVNLKKI